jgi:hypothetical protein
LTVAKADIVVLHVDITTVLCIQLPENCLSSNIVQVSKLDAFRFLLATRRGK